MTLLSWGGVTQNHSDLALVTGATGVVGPSLIRALRGESTRVRAMARRKRWAEGEGTEFFEADLLNQEKVKRALEGVGSVFHLAGKLHVNNPGEDLKAEYWRVNVDGSLSLARAAREAGVSTFIFFSTISVYGPTAPESEWLDESSPPLGDSLYARSKKEAEEAVLSELPQATILRASSVCGPTMKGNYLSMLEALDRGIFPLIGRGNNRRTLVQTDDLSRAAVLCSHSASARGRVFNVSDGKVHSLHEIIQAMCAALGKGPPRVRLPLGPIQLGTRTVDAVARAWRLPIPSLSHLLAKLNEDVAVRADRIRAETGFVASHDLSSIWREVAEARRFPSNPIRYGNLQ